MHPREYEETRSHIRGLVLNQPTPFRPVTFEVDVDSLRQNIDYWIENGLLIVLITGGTSDFTCLSDHEIAELTKVTVDAVNGRAIVIAATNSRWLGQTIAFARYCVEIGADVLMIQKHEPPQASAQDYYEYHQAIADECPIPLFYHSFLTGKPSVKALLKV